MTGTRNMLGQDATGLDGKGPPTAVIALVRQGAILTRVVEGVEGMAQKGQ